MPDLNKTVPEQYLKEEKISSELLPELSGTLNTLQENTATSVEPSQQTAVRRALNELRAPVRQYPWGKNHKPFVSETLTEIRKSLAERRVAQAHPTDIFHHESVYSSLTPEQKINILQGTVDNPFDIKKRVTRGLNPVRRVAGRPEVHPSRPKHLWNKEILKDLKYYKPGFVVISGLEPNSTPDELFFDLPADPRELVDATENDLLVGGFDMLEVFNTDNPGQPLVQNDVIKEILPLENYSEDERAVYHELFTETLRRWYERQFDWDDPMQAAPSTMLEKIQKRGLENLPVTAPVGFAASKTIGIIPTLLAAKFLTPFLPKIAPPLLTGVSRAMTKLIPEEYKDAAWRRANRSVTGKMRQSAINKAEHHAFVAPELKLWAKRRPIALRPHTYITDFRRALKSLKTDETREILAESGIKPDGMTLMLIPQFEAKADFNLHDSNTDQERVVRDGLESFFESLHEVIDERGILMSQSLQDALLSATMLTFGSEAVWRINHDTPQISEFNQNPKVIDAITTVHQGVSPMISRIISDIVSSHSYDK